MYPHHSNIEAGGTEIIEEILDIVGWDVFTSLLGAEEIGASSVLEESDRETTILTPEEKTRLKVFATGSGDNKLREEMEALMSVNRLALDYFAKQLRAKGEGPDSEGPEAPTSSD